MVVGDITTGTDVLVIGAGPAGYVAAIRAAQLDLDVTLVEKDAYGGTCLNRGCIPSKALIYGSKLAHEAATAEEMGIHADPAVDLAGMMNWKDDVVADLTGGVEQLCEANGVTLLEGRAEFADANSVRIVHGGEGQGSESLSFEHCIVATGSRPIQIPNFDFADEPVLSSTDALSLDSIPEKLVVVGAGYIGMELAGVYARLGTDVTVVELLERPLPNYEADVARVVEERAEDLGVEFHYGYGASDWEPAGDGDSEGIVVRAEPVEEAATDGGAEAATAEREALELPADRVLVAVGRQPVTDTLSLEAAGLETDDRGFVPTDDRCRTAVEHIFAVGDVAGEPMLAHTGSAEGQVAAECIAGEPAAFDAQAIPAAVFTDPEIATVGLTEEEAADDGFDPVVGTFPFQASGRALSTNDTDGFVRLVGDADSGFVLGGQIVGAEASELIAEVAHAIEMGATLRELAATVHTHPTRSEAVMEAAENALGRAIHTLNR